MDHPEALRTVFIPVSWENAVPRTAHNPQLDEHRASVQQSGEISQLHPIPENVVAVASAAFALLGETPPPGTRAETPPQRYSPRALPIIDELIQPQVSPHVSPLGKKSPAELVLEKHTRDCFSAMARRSRSASPHMMRTPSPLTSDPQKYFYKLK